MINIEVDHNNDCVRIETLGQKDIPLSIKVVSIKGRMSEIEELLEHIFSAIGDVHTTQLIGVTLSSVNEDRRHTIDEY